MQNSSYLILFLLQLYFVEAFAQNNRISDPNYTYDELGQLKSDKKEEIQEIIWTMYGKVKEIIRTPGSSKNNLKFDYDGLGNRVEKHVYTSAGEWLYSEYYVRDMNGNIMSVYKRQNDSQMQTASFKQTETYIYGNELIGINKTETELIGTPPNDNHTYSRTLGTKFYNAKNHLGNVLTVFTDIKIPHSTDGVTIDYYKPHIVSATDYYPYGYPMPGRTFNGEKFRLGFNGQEKVNEINGTGNHYTAQFWEYDPRLGRRWNLDPKPNPSISPYACFNDNPIWFSDALGDTVRLTEAFQAHRAWMNRYNTWAESEQGKKFLKNYGIGGKYEHLSVVFDVGHSASTIYGKPTGQTKTFFVHKETKEVEGLEPDKIYENARRIALGTDKNSYLRFTLLFNEDITAHPENLSYLADNANTILHETQHLRINQSTLLTNQAIQYSYFQHLDWMRPRNSSWYQERYDFYENLRYLWYEDYLNNKNKGEVRDVNDYIDREINDFRN